MPKKLPDLHVMVVSFVTSPCLQENSVRKKLPDLQYTCISRLLYNIVV
jgi:hypothetical protein